MKPFDFSDAEISRWLASFLEPEDSLRNPAIVPREMLLQDGYAPNGRVWMSPKGLWGWTSSGWGPRGMTQDPAIGMQILQTFTVMAEVNRIEIEEDHVALFVATGEPLFVDLVPGKLTRGLIELFYLFNEVPEVAKEMVN